MTKKGIVISPPFKAIPGGIELGGNIDPQDVRKYLLYWDEIDYPTNNALSVGLSDDLSFLQNCGILRRTHVTIQGSFLLDGKVMIAAQEHVFKENEKNEKGKWSLAQLSDTQFYTQTTPEVGIEFELANCLPVPQGDVPLNDILEFKQKRESELLALRIYLNDLYQSIIIARDIPRAKNAALDKLELALKDLNKAMDESCIKKTITYLRGTIAGALDSGLRAQGAASLYEVSYGMDAFAIGSIVSFAIKPMLLPQSTGSANPLTYIKSIKQELGK